MNKSKFLKHSLLVICGFIGVFTLLYMWLIGQSGGDLALGLFSVIFLVVYTLVIGFITYAWDFKAKLGVISGLLICYILAYVLFIILLY